jgi:septal ring factor EnvC (AmiA/AmiB activator)
MDEINEIARTQREINKVQSEIECIEQSISQCEDNIASNCVDVQYWRDKESRLRDKETRLRDKENILLNILRDEKNRATLPGIVFSCFKNLGSSKLLPIC